MSRHGSRRGRVTLSRLTTSQQRNGERCGAHRAVTTCLASTYVCVVCCADMYSARCAAHARAGGGPAGSGARECFHFDVHLGVHQMLRSVSTREVTMLESKLNELSLGMYEKG